MIKVSGLTKDYGARRAIHNLSFDAQHGEIVGLLGPNGAGKTTTMRILTGYMPPTDGEAIVAGYDVVEESLEVRKRVGYLPESVPLYYDMAVFDYLKYMGELRRVPNVGGARLPQAITNLPHAWPWRMTQTVTACWWRMARPATKSTPTPVWAARLRLTRGPGGGQLGTAGGVLGIVADRVVMIGKPHLLRNEKITGLERLEASAGKLHEEGKTAMFVAIDGKPAGILAVADPIKSTTAEAIRELHTLGLKLVMLTGDNRRTAAAVARQLGLDAVQAGTSRRTPPWKGIDPFSHQTGVSSATAFSLSAAASRKVFRIEPG